MTGSSDVPARSRVAIAGLPDPVRSGGDSSSRLGVWAAGAVVFLGVTTAVVGATTPPRSGPMCQLAECVTSPYTGVAEFVPRDYLWLYPALALQVAFLVVVTVLVGTALRDRPAQALAALAFAVLGTGLLVVDYGVQLFVVQPSLLAGEADALSLWSQYNPHGIFIGLENLGYAALAISFFFLGAVLAGGSGLLRVARWVFLIGGALTWVALVGLAVGYRAELEYRFELAAISLYWLVLVVTGAVLAVTYHRGALGREEATV